MNKKAKKHILNISFVAILAILTIITLLNSFDELNFHNISIFFSDCNPFYILLAFLCLGGFIFFEALSLHIILKKLGYKPKIRSSIAYATADTYYSAITPSATGGQPASAYYMVKDGISGGTSGFTLIFNLVGYTAAIVIIGVLGLVLDFKIFTSLSLFIKIVVSLGLFFQVSLLMFFILCMRWHSGLKKICNFIINLLSKTKIIKRKEKWLTRIDSAIEKYKNCYDDFLKNKSIFIPVLICNILQRISQILISVFVCKSAIDCNFIDIFVMQTLVVIGYNSIPLPGGVGAFEYLYLKIYGFLLPSSFIIISMMVTRVISYYLNIIISGIYTVIYHVSQIRKRKKDLVESKLNI